MLVDLGGLNGTKVNGVRIEGSAALRVGDTITINDTVLVLRGVSTSAPSAREATVSARRFETQLSGEVERATNHDSQLALVVVAFDVGLMPRVLEQVVSPTLRALDVMTWLADRRLALLFPEVNVVELPARVKELERLVERHSSGAKLGYALFPTDAVDATSLMQAANSACDAAGQGLPSAADSTVKVVDLGDTKSLLADPLMMRAYELLGRLAKSELPVLVLVRRGRARRTRRARYTWARAGRRGRSWR